jgi:hypothetical protein
MGPEQTKPTADEVEQADQADEVQAGPLDDDPWSALERRVAKIEEVLGMDEEVEE